MSPHLRPKPATDEVKLREPDMNAEAVEYVNTMYTVLTGAMNDFKYMAGKLGASRLRGTDVEDLARKDYIKLEHMKQAVMALLRRIKDEIEEPEAVRQQEQLLLDFQNALLPLETWDTLQEKKKDLKPDDLYGTPPAEAKPKRVRKKR